MEKIAYKTITNCEECHEAVVDKLDEVVEWINKQEKREGGSINPGENARI